MNIELAYGILEIFQTMKEAVMEMKDKYAKGELQTFHILSKDLEEGLVAVQDVAKKNVLEGDRIRLYDACTCALESLKDVRGFVVTNPEKVAWKLEYELMAIIETAAMQFYYWAIVDVHPETRGEFYEFIENTDTFALLKVPEEERKFSNDLVINVTAYNKLDYTKQCVESILDNLPEGIDCELILFNHGSSDGTKEYFESIEGAKVINIAVNGAVPGVTTKISLLGKYSLSISNDIIVGNNTIDNLFRCISENIDYGYVVPSTSAVSNLQTIPVKYKDISEFKRFTLENNVYNEMKHEQRIRLCNPVTMTSSVVWLQMLLEMYEVQLCCKNPMAFPDDKSSLWIRRNGYKSILAKDAYCHHFGSVTVKEDSEIQQQQQEFYLEGRKAFFLRYGIDPWGTGFCYDPELFHDWKLPIIDNAMILGINCGLGSNSLKVKEILKENGAEGMVLHNATQEGRYFHDLQGISDETFLFWNLSDMILKNGIKKYNYIVIDDSINGESAQDSLQKVLNAGLLFDELAWRTSSGEWEIVKASNIL